MKRLLPEQIDTARCRLRPFEPGDLDDLYRLYRDPKVMATRKIGIQNKAQTKKQLQDIVALWNERGFGLYAVFERGGDVFVGECGFRLFAKDQPEIVELSYGLRPIYWGGGIATEIATAMITAGFQGFVTETLFAHAKVQNAASLRVLQKLGFVRCDERALGLPPGLARCELRHDRWKRQMELGHFPTQ